MKNRSKTVTVLIMNKLLLPYIYIVITLFVLLAILYPALYGFTGAAITCSLIYMTGAVALLLLRTFLKPVEKGQRGD